jgi:hypothetical protein
MFGILLLHFLEKMWCTKIKQNHNSLYATGKNAANLGVSAGH